MNVPNYLEKSPFAFPAIIAGSVILSALISVLLFRKRLF
jgi:hypothetical protein